MSHKCPQCGAELLAEETCRARFDLCLALEYENPTAYGAVHHLTVTCYMLQHNMYSGDVWLEARNMLAQFLHEGVAPAEMRRRNRQKYAGERRQWSVTKGEKLSEVDAIVWSRTIADVRLDDPDAYCADVERWAASILADSQAIIYPGL